MEDIIGKSAVNPMDAMDTDFINNVVRKYLPRIAKKMDGKDTSTRSIMADTLCVAGNVLARIKEVPFYELSMSVYVYCADEGYRYISRQFEMILELAGMNEEKFVMGLHGFYNNLSSKLRKPGMMEAFAQFMNLFMRLRYEKTQRYINPNVILAYTDLILQTFDYLRPNKLDLTKSVVGISTSGELLTIEPDPVAYIQLASMEFLLDVLNLKCPPEASRMEGYYNRYGFLGVKSPNDGEALLRRARIFESIRAHMFPLINEYTYDIMPKKHHTGNIRMWAMASTDLNADDIIQKLKHRRRTLPTNGVRVKLTDGVDELQELLLKEVVYLDSVYLLFKLTTQLGDIVGYFQPSTGFFFSPFIEAQNQELVNYAQCVILFFYAQATLDDPAFSDAECENHFTNFIFSMKAESYMQGGRLRNTYNPDYVPSGARKADERFDTKEVFINGFIRRLPEGQQASEESIAKAKALGYDLQPNETFVSPFTKHIFYLRDNEPEDTTEGTP